MFSRSFLAASIAACSSFVFAAEATLPTTVVTATRTTQSVDDSLASVQVITQEQLAQHPSQDLGEILRFTTGIDIARLGGFGGQTSTFIRGTESNHTLVLIDGIRINSATSSQANIQNLTLDDIERVEVVKGGMSSLYGSEAIGGVINIITKTPNKTSSQATISAGSHKLVKGGFNQTFKQNALSALINANAFYTNGFDIIEKSTREYGYKNHGVNLKANYDLGFSQISVTARQNKGTTEYHNFGFVTQDFENQLISLHAQGKINDTLNSQIRLSQLKDHIDQNQSSSLAHTKQQQADWQNTFALSSEITLVAGITQTNTEAQYDNGFGTKYDKEQDNLAVYLQQQSQFSQISTQLSLRHEDYDSFGTHQTGTLALGYSLNNQHRIYANYGTAFKAPDLNDLYGYGGNVNLKPEESTSVEVGSKHTIGQFKLNTAFYQYDIDNLISCVGGFPCQNINVDKASIKGIELGVNWQQDGLMFGLNGGYNHAQDDMTKQDLLRRPRRSLSFTTGYNQEKWGISSEVLAKSHALDAPLFGSNTPRRLAGYAVANVNAYWQVVPSTKLRVSLENITDKTYSFAYSGATTRYLATPFTATISAEVKF
ncbi:TonB-dependent receptor [uncultured Agitococcus sp.]|uniref:TonB-dependent receptor domain-containing protein n=1 Tax=uncultured Agitococcus sp. TaxID=1506599 RepID=UPI002617933A|nr:TonB-dependent receptor [uncultured Agitococcus sp.]